jgi:hypothetical protein
MSRPLEWVFFLIFGFFSISICSLLPNEQGLYNDKNTCRLRKFRRSGEAVSNISLKRTSQVSTQGLETFNLTVFAGSKPIKVLDGVTLEEVDEVEKSITNWLKIN